MRRVICFYWVLFLFFSISGQGKDPFALSLKEIRPTMDRIFSHHIEIQTFIPKVAQRSIKIYIEQFDPNRMYLLKEEVDHYLEISSEKLEGLIENYMKGRFFEYFDLNETIKGAIKRMRKIRDAQIERLIREGKEALQSTSFELETGYPLSEEELKDRVYRRLILEVKAHLQIRKEVKVTSTLIKKILIHRSKKAFLFEEDYFDPSEHFLTLHILKAIAKSLDAHTGYYSPKEAYHFSKALEKEFCGIGVIFREDFDGIYVADFIRNGPADVSKKVQVGDLLFSVNGQKIEEKSFGEFLELMQGRLGDTIQLGIKREGQIFEVNLPCEKICMNGERVTFSYEPYGEGFIGKIQIPSFYDNGRGMSAFHDLKQALRTLQSKGNLMGVILDFRENSGGFFNQAVQISSLFVQGGLIVMSKDASGKIGYFRGINGKKFFEGPVLILISKASASASEIVAQSLQDHGVALIVGDQRTYGKGSIQFQTITNKKGGSFFKVTVGRYYTPSGRCPQIRGVQGDVFVPTPLFCQNVGEKYLQFPLAGEDLNRDLFDSLIFLKKDPFSQPVSFQAPHLKPFDSKWRKMLPVLKENSQNRIEKSQNYQFFLNEAQKGAISFNGKGEAQGKNYGTLDLQMQESVEIMKDMLLINREKRLQ